MRVVLLMAVVCFMALPAVAIAQGNIHLGKLQIDPYVSLSEIWSDNVYYTPTDELSDRISVYTPGVQLQFPFGVHRFEAEYYAIFNRYTTYGGEDTTDQMGHGLLDFRFGSYLGLTVSDDYAKSHEDRGESATGFIEVYRENAQKASVYYQMADRSKVQIEYSKTSYNFMTSDFRDRDESLVAGYLYYRFLPKTSAFIEYDHKSVDYTLPVNTTGGLSLDNTQDAVYVGITWEATSTSKGTIKAGRMKKNFTADAVTDLTMWSWRVDIDHKFSDHTSLKLVGMREPNETNYFGTSYYITTGASVDFSHRMLSKTDLLLTGSYGKDDFSNARKDTTTLAGGGLKYWIRDWWDVGVLYRWRRRDSNLDAADYTEHRTMVSMDVMF